MDEVAGQVTSFKKIDVPVHYVNGFNFAWAGNDACLICGNSSPALLTVDGKEELGIAVDHKLMITFSSESLKDLYLIIGTAISEHEKVYGEIKTNFTNMRKMGSE